MIHVLNGDATRLKLERSGVPGTFIVWADVLHEGPTPAGLSPDEWRRVRARSLATPGAGATDETDIENDYRAADERLDRITEHDEAVFWFEHDLYDQLLLIRHLDWLAARSIPESTRLSLICIGSFPGIPDFVGLGQLTPEQLASLLDTRKPITPDQIDTGRRAWRAFCAAGPGPLLSVRSSNTSALPFLAGALDRHLEEYPWTVDGLARSERQVLAAVSHGARTPVAAFLATQRMEERVFMGDLPWWTIVRRLAAATRPLLTIEGDLIARDHLPSATLSLTAIGHDVLAGRADHVALNGIDRWLGGVHLTSDTWRWDNDHRVLRGGSGGA